MIRLLKEALGEEYESVAKQTRIRRSTREAHRANTGRKRGPMPMSQRQAISQAKMGKSLSDEHRQSISEGLHRHIADNGFWHDKATCLEIGRKSRDTKRQQGLYEEFGRKISQRWAVGCYENLYGSGLWRSKIEERVEEVLSDVYEVEGSHRLAVEGRRYCFDILLVEHLLLIEINGDYWHCNPSKYDAEFFHPHRKLNSKAIWEYDSLKAADAQVAGFNTLTLWEEDVNRWTDNEILEAVKCHLHQS